ncbi:MAG: hypothetical protein AB7G75_08615 [Candidatus Binatia bacterium]
MLKRFVAAYELGYAAGLRRATAVRGEEQQKPQGQYHSQVEWSEVTAQPAYQEGCVAGFVAGFHVMAARQQVTPGSSPGRTCQFPEVMNLLSDLQQGLCTVFQALRRAGRQPQDGAAGLRERLAHAEAVLKGFPAAGTTTFLDQR